MSLADFNVAPDDHYATADGVCAWRDLQPEVFPACPATLIAQALGDPNDIRALAKALLEEADAIEQPLVQLEEDWEHIQPATDRGTAGPLSFGPIPATAEYEASENVSTRKAKAAV